MKKARSVRSVLEEIVAELEAGRVPGPIVIREARASLKAAAKASSKSQKAATAASVASGNSGRKPTFDREAIKRHIRDNSEESFVSISERFHCSSTLISVLAKEVRETK